MRITIYNSGEVSPLANGYRVDCRHQSIYGLIIAHFK